MRKARQSEYMVKPRILLVINSEIAAGLQPRDEYEAIQQVLDADVLYPHDAQRTIIGRFISRLLGARIALIWTAFWQRDKYDIIYTDTELVGLPLAMLLKLRGTQGRQFRYVTLSHYLSPFKKKIFFHLGVGSRIDTLIVYSAAQQALATEVLRMPAERVVKLPFFVDKDFWRPVAIDRNATNNRPMIFVPGLECRDFATLIRAVSDLDVEVRITATTAFGRGQFVAFSALPPNVSIGSCDFAEMRQLYTIAQFVVVPLREVDFQAGVTVILEAMAMGKAVIVSGTRGQTDIVRDPRNNGRGLVVREQWPGFLDAPGVAETLGCLPTGFYVTPGDAEDLRQTIQYLLDHPEVAEELGSNGRCVVEAYFGLDAFAQRFATTIRGESLPTEVDAMADSSAGRGFRD